jgi:5-methylthioadenosine/S-adenosylhomocysteine deaminase
VADLATPKPCDLQLSNGFVVTMANGGEICWPGFVAIQGRDIVGVGPSECADEWRAAIILDCSDSVILPGFISCHVHAGISLLKAAAAAADLLREPEIAWAFIEATTEDSAYVGTRLGCLQMMKAGITTFADMWPFPDANAEAVKSVGMRAVLAPYTRSYDARGFDTIASAASRWMDDRLTPAIGIHSLRDCSRETLGWAGDAARAHDLKVHADAARSKAGAGDGRCIAEAKEMGVLRRGTVLVGCADATEEEFNVAAECGAGIACVPVSDAQLARSVSPLSRWKQRMLVGLGTDISGAQGRHDFFDEMRMAILMDRVSIDDSKLKPRDALEMATIDGARVLGMEHTIGSLEIGKRADLITVRLDDPRFAPLHWDRPDQVLSHLLFAAAPIDIATVIVDGRVLFQNQRALHLDEEEIVRESREASTTCLAKAGLK